MSSSSHEVILISSPDGPIMAYEASNGATIARFTGSRSPCRGLTMAGRGFIAASHVFSDTGAGSINIYNWYTPTVFCNLIVPEPVAPLTATFDGAFLFAGGLSGSIHSLSLPSGNVIKSFVAHSKPVSSLQLSNDGSLMISGSDDGTIVVIPTFRLVDASSLAGDDTKDLTFHQWKAHSDSVTAFNSRIGLCSSTLVSCSLDCTCKFWTLSDGILLRTVAFPCAIFGVAIDSTESGFYAAGANGLVYKESMKVGSQKQLGKAYELIAWSKSHSGSIVSLVLVNSGKNLVSATEDGSVWMWDVDKEKVIMVLGNEMGSISDMIVAQGTTEYGVRKGNATSDEASGFTSSRLCDEEMMRTLKQITELGDVVDVVANDKKRAIDMLESTIGMYERLLRLILKEALKAISSNEDEEMGEEEDDKDREGRKDDR